MITNMMIMMVIVIITITVPKVFAAFVSFEILLLKMIVIMITNMMIMKW